MHPLQRGKRWEARGRVSHASPLILYKSSERLSAAMFLSVFRVSMPTGQKRLKVKQKPWNCKVRESHLYSGKCPWWMELHQTDSSALLLTMKKKRKGGSKMLGGKWPQGKVRLPFHQVQNGRDTRGGSVFTGQMRLQREIPRNLFDIWVVWHP